MGLRAHSHVQLQGAGGERDGAAGGSSIRAGAGSLLLRALLSRDMRGTCPPDLHAGQGRAGFYMVFIYAFLTPALIQSGPSSHYFCPLLYMQSSWLQTALILSCFQQTGSKADDCLPHCSEGACKEKGLHKEMTYRTVPLEIRASSGWQEDTPQPKYATCTQAECYPGDLSADI